MAWRRFTLAAIMAGGWLAITGCGGEQEGPPMKIDWDLSSRHTRAEVHWPREYREEYSTQVKPIDSVRIRLPAHKLLRMPEQAESIILYRRSQGPEPLPGPKGEVLDKVEVYSEPLNVEDAYRRALAYADEFGLPAAPLQGWRKRRDQGADPVTDRTYVGDDKPLGGKDGPLVGVELNYSSDDKRPWVVSVRVVWLAA